MSVVVIREGKLEHQENNMHYVVECESCSTVYAFDKLEIKFDPSISIDTYVTCPCCNRITYSKKFEPISPGVYRVYNRVKQNPKTPYIENFKGLSRDELWELCAHPLPKVK